MSYGKRKYLNINSLYLRIGRIGCNLQRIGGRIGTDRSRIGRIGEDCAHSIRGLGASGVSATYRGTERGDRITQHAVPKTSTKYGPHVLRGAGLADCIKERLLRSLLCRFALRIVYVLNGAKHSSSSSHLGRSSGKSRP